MVALVMLDLRSASPTATVAEERPIGPRGESRQVFAELDPGQLRLDDAVFTPDLGRRIGFGVKGLVLGRTTRLKDKNDRFRSTFGRLRECDRLGFKP